MHHLELKVSSVQLWWHPGTSRKCGSPSSGWWHPVCHVPGLCPSFLPVKGLSASGAGSIPLAGSLSTCLCWRYAYCPIPSRQLSLSGSPSITEPASDSHTQDLVVSVFKHARRQPSLRNHAGQSVSRDRTVCRLIFFSPSVHSASGGEREGR